MMLCGKKKQSENKHPSGTDFLKPDPEPKSKSNIRMYGLVMMGILICAVGGYFGYEYYSLSRPMMPQQPASLVATTMPPSAQTEQTAAEKDNQENKPVVPVKTAAPAVLKSEAPVREAETKPQTPPPLKSESPKVAPAEQKDTPVQPPGPEPKLEKAARQASTPPTPVIEPDGPTDPSPKSLATPKTTPQKDLAPTQITSDQIAERFYRKGLSYHRQDDLDRAIQMYLAARKKNPHHIATSFNLASAYIQVGAFSAAHTILTDLHLKEPDSPEVLLNMAVVELGLDRPEEALKLLERAEIKFPGPRYEILFHQGTALSRLGNFTEALARYQKAQRMAPPASRLPLNIAIAHDNLAQYDKAIEYYQSFLDQNKFLSTPERREIENRVRELIAFLTWEKASSTE